MCKGCDLDLVLNKQARGLKHLLCTGPEVGLFRYRAGGGGSGAGGREKGA